MMPDGIPDSYNIAEKGDISHKHRLRLPCLTGLDWHRMKFDTNLAVDFPYDDAVRQVLCVYKGQLLLMQN